MTIKTKVTKNGNLKISGVIQEVLNLMPGDKVFVTVHKEFNKNQLYIPDAMLEKAGIDSTGGITTYIENGSIVITESDEIETFNPDDLFY